MSSEVIVRLEGVSKRFKLYGGTRDRLLDWVCVPPGHRYEEFWALRDITCEVRQGECLGIIGPNGAGKSTLLKLLTGSLYPTSGQIEVRGKVLSLLELGTGFTPELSGRQNVEQSARLLGFPSGYGAHRVREIQDFAELGEYFDRPIKFYSSGMLVRLAFSLFSAMQPEVFLVDEALAVGDLRFASKAFGRIRRMLEAGTTLLFVSHDLQLINQLCTRTLWLHSGTVQMDGLPSAVTRAYQQFVVHGAASSEPPLPPDDVTEVKQSTGAATTDVQPALSLGSGWYPLEAYQGEIFRWAAADAELLVPNPGTGVQELLLDVEPVLPGGTTTVPLDVVDGIGQLLARVDLTTRAVVRVPVPRGEASAHKLYLRSVLATAAADGRVLSFRAFRWGWVDDDRGLRPIGQASEWVDAVEPLELERQLAAMRQTLRRCAPVANSPARITSVVTRVRQEANAVRFAVHSPLTLEIIVEAARHLDRPVVGVQVRDVFDRMVWTTRSDWQGLDLPALEAGHFIAVSFSTEKLLLGRGLYQVTVAVHRWQQEDRIFHWIDGAWKFEVIESGSEDFKGAFDLGWQCATESPRETTALDQVARTR